MIDDGPPLPPCDATREQLLAARDAAKAWRPDGLLWTVYEMQVKRMDELKKLREEGCCGCMREGGECGGHVAALQLRMTRREAGMGRATLGLIGDLCPRSEWWMAYEVTGDAAAVFEARRERQRERDRQFAEECAENKRRFLEQERGRS